MRDFLWFMWQMAKTYKIAARQPVYFGRSDEAGVVDVVVLFARGRNSNFVNEFVHEFMENQGAEFRNLNESK